MKQQEYNQNQMGWTLVELMITVAIVGIIGAIAVPSYMEHIRESRRTDARTELMQLKMEQEAYRLENNSYASAAQLGVAPTEFYTFSVSNVSATTYTLVATAKGAQLKDTACTTINLDQSMNKTPTECW
ncbi:type IV pilin protein [Alteromonas sp. H39]|uniref:type IV pilin protein n=1 Tax=Alteromonas sp. H39 TaxID=3389876 RepID=UPI0039E0C979